MYIYVYNLYLWNLSKRFWKSRLQNAGPIVLALMCKRWFYYLISKQINRNTDERVGFGNDNHYNDVIMGVMASQITNLTSVYSTVYSGVDQRKHQSSASLAFVWGIDQGPVNSPHKWPVTRKMLPFDDVIMSCDVEFSPQEWRRAMVVPTMSNWRHPITVGSLYFLISIQHANPALSLDFPCIQVTV